MAGPAFFAELPVVATLIDGPAVPVRHTNFATYAIDESGTRWIRKREPNIGYQELLAESLAWLVGTELGVPLPRSAVHTDEEGNRSWLSEQIDHVVHWNPELTNVIENPAGMGAMIALDAILLNPDRHQGNILLQPIGNRGRWHVWAIDHDQVLLAYPTTAGATEIP